jgi:hypothetical protein
MGILDDAIREHLELKRSHGAPDSELQRMEDEAFGPPTRPGEPDFPEGDTDHAGNGAGHEEPRAEADSQAGEPFAEVAEADAPSGEHDLDDREAQPPGEEDHADAEAIEEDHVEAEEQTALYDRTADSHEAPIESLDTVEHPMPEEEPQDEGDEESSDSEASAEEDEDVLADTPEFLKDAPEDDELWFEQGKPKDFDF